MPDSPWAFNLFAAATLPGSDELRGGPILAGCGRRLGFQNKRRFSDTLLLNRTLVDPEKAHPICS